MNQENKKLSKPKCKLAWTWAQHKEYGLKIVELGERKMMKQLPFEKVAWAVGLDDDTAYPVSHKQDKNGNMQIFIEGRDGTHPISKRDLVYCFDLYAEDGTLINIMWLGL